MNYMDQRVSSSTDPSSSRDQDSWRTEESNRYDRRERSRSPRRDYRRSRSPRDSYRSRSPRHRLDRPGTSRRSPSPRDRDRYHSRRENSRDYHSRRSPSPRDRYRRDEDYREHNLQDEDYRRDIPRREDTRNYEEKPSEDMNHTLRVRHPIPENCIGLVIGRNGMEINSISQKSGCRVTVDTDDVSSPGLRMVEIVGPRDSIPRAIELVEEVVARVVVRPPTGGHPTYPASNTPAHDDEHRTVTIEIPIPANKCGSIIGKGGETMKKLRSWSKCHIQLIQENNIADMDKPLRITGEAKCVEHARKMVTELLEETAELPPPPGHAGNGHVAQATVHLEVPRASVGAIMGVQGSNIKNLSEETGTKIQFLHDSDPNMMTRSLAIIGTKHKVNLASQLIKSMIETEKEKLSDKNLALFYLSIPASKCGLVIGRSGETIKQINHETGAHCELARECQDNQKEKTFVIRGTEDQVEHAKHMIAVKVGDIPPNTPFVPPSAARQQQYQQQQQYQMAGQQSQHPGMQQQQPNVQMWAGQPIIQQQQPGFPAQSNPAFMIQPATIAAWQQLQAVQQQKQQMMQQQKQQMMQQQNMLPPHQQMQQHQQMMQQQQMQQHQQMAHQQLMQQQMMHQQQMMQRQQMQQQMQQQQHFQQQQFQQGQAPFVSPSQQHQAISPQQQQQPQQMVRQAPTQPAAPQPLIKGPIADNPESGLSLYAQYALKTKAEFQAREEAAAAAAAAKQQATTAPQRSAEPEPEQASEEEKDYSQQWYDYYISINNKEGAAAVLQKIEEKRAEKALREAAASSSK